MRTVAILATFILLQLVSFSQNIIEGERLLELLDKPTTDPLFQQVKQQENFFTDAWSSELSLYITVTGGIIKELEVENGKMRYGSKERYGIFKKTLPLRLNWSMMKQDIETLLGKPVLISESMNFSDYKKDGLAIRIFYEINKPVSISFRRDGATTKSTPPVTTNPVNPPASTSSKQEPTWVVRLGTDGNAQVNWSGLKQLIFSSANHGALAGKDSVDYIGQVYYSTGWKAEGFDRTAIKRIKSKNQWFYEAFYKSTADSEQVRKIFFSLYDNLKKTIKENAGDDFILASVAKEAISTSPMNWMAQWTLYSNYKTFPSGLGKVRILLMLSGLKDVFNENKMNYTFKIYVFDKDVSIDFFTWDKPGE